MCWVGTHQQLKQTVRNPPEDIQEDNDNTGARVNPEPSSQPSQLVSLCQGRLGPGGPGPGGAEADHRPGDDGAPAEKTDPWQFTKQPVQPRG